MLHLPAQIRLIINGTEYHVRPDRPPAIGRPLTAPAEAPLTAEASLPDESLPLRGLPAASPGTPPPRAAGLSPRTALVSTDVVRAVLGVDAAAVASLVESGELAWVFDLSARQGKLRELRYWARELFAPEQCQITPARAIQLILGKRRQRWRGTEIEQLLLASRATILRWHRAGDLPGERVDHTFWVNREDLANFLRSRLHHPGGA